MHNTRCVQEVQSAQCVVQQADGLFFGQRQSSSALQHFPEVRTRLVIHHHEQVVDWPILLHDDQVVNLGREHVLFYGSELSQNLYLRENLLGLVLVQQGVPQQLDGDDRLGLLVLSLDDLAKGANTEDLHELIL